MSLIAEEERLTWIPPKVTKVQRPAVRMQDHDLPVLALQESPRHVPDWETLMAMGVQPALILGAERRLQGRR